MLSPLGAVYVPPDPHNPDQVLGQFGFDLSSNSETSLHLLLLLQSPSKQPAQGPLPGIGSSVTSL